jgi:lysozyme
MLLAEWEGVELTVYRDIAGMPTIGVGHLLTKDELSSGKVQIGDVMVQYGFGLTPEQAMDLLAQDLANFENSVQQCVKVPLQQNQFDALVAFCFNIGGEAFRNSTLVRLLNQQLYQDVPGQLRRWVHSGGQLSRGLANRREKEIALWNATAQVSAAGA